MRCPNVDAFSRSQNAVDAISRFSNTLSFTQTQNRVFRVSGVLFLKDDGTVRKRDLLPTWQTGFKMGPELLKEELSDIQEVVMTYSHNNAARKIADRSAVLEKLWEAFSSTELKGRWSLH